MDCIKHLILPHAFNVRDMGGILTESGRAVQWNRLFRADALSALDTAEWQTLYKKGVRTVVDLRSLSETETFPDRVPDGIALHHCPMQEENLDIHNLDEGAAAAFRRSMSECYADMIRKTPHLLCAALHAVQDALHGRQRPHRRARRCNPHDSRRIRFGYTCGLRGIQHLQPQRSAQASGKYAELRGNAPDAFLCARAYGRASAIFPRKRFVLGFGGKRFYKCGLCRIAGTAFDVKTQEILRRGQVTASPFPFCRLATFSLSGKSSPPPTICKSDLYRVNFSERHRDRSLRILISRVF